MALGVAEEETTGGVISARKTVKTMGLAYKSKTN